MKHFVSCQTTLFFLKPVNFELRMTVLNFLPISSLICSKILRIWTSSLATMFVKLLNYRCSVCLSKCFFCCLYSIVKLHKQKGEFFQFEQQPKIFSVTCTIRNSQHHSIVLKLLSFCLQIPENHKNFVFLNQYKKFSLFSDL